METLLPVDRKANEAKQPVSSEHFSIGIGHNDVETVYLMCCVLACYLNSRVKCSRIHLLKTSREIP